VEKEDTKICKFLQDLEPHKKYTKEEMRQYCIDKFLAEIINFTKYKEYKKVFLI
jgi:hypothetical protein